MTKPSFHPAFAPLCRWIFAALTLLIPSSAAPAQTAAGLTFAERVEFQRAIEEIYWRHRIWPKERPDAKPSFEASMPAARLEEKVRDYLRDAELLEQFWGERLTQVRLQGEMDRMARQSQRPGVLKELFAALGDDPAVIAECVARPTLSRTLLTQRYARDPRFHGELRRSAEAELETFRSTEQMKSTGGNYREIEWIKSATGERSSATAVQLGEVAWQEELRRLATRFPQRAETRIGDGTAETDADVPVETISRLQETDEAFSVVSVISRSADRVQLATIEWPKEPFDVWRARHGSGTPSAARVATRGYRLPTLRTDGSTCNDDTWTPTLNVPAAREAHTAVWTGSEMIVWGGTSNNSPNDANGGERYDPATDTWTAISAANAPSPRGEHTAVWTGSEMIVWGGVGGINYLNTGGRYDPMADSWRATSLVNAPPGRGGPVAVWTGTEMIVWGGRVGGGTAFLNTGGRYVPLTDTWVQTSTLNAPAPRNFHTAVWTGTEMIVWGGLIAAPNTSSEHTNTGGRYNPVTDIWIATQTANAPGIRSFHSAVWTGSKMIICGGSNGNAFLNTGGLYDPVTGSWSPTSTTNAPPGRAGHTSVWTGTEMIVWGGQGIGTGGRYDPATNSWSLTNAAGAPPIGRSHTAVWTGEEMIVFGGSDYTYSVNLGGKYKPATNSWTPTRNTNAPAPRSRHSALWTGSEMIVWGGGRNTGGIYDPATDSWTATTTAGAPSVRSDSSAVWTGTEMIVWGGWHNPGVGNQLYNDGRRYDPALNRWLPTALTNAPVPRRYHTAVWTGAEMIVWGGENSTGNTLNTGGRYNPISDTWLATSTADLPVPRRHHSAFWTGTEMLVWGGTGDGGARYDPGADRWRTMSTVNAPVTSYGSKAVWTGNDMILWHASGFGTDIASGKYNPSTDTWATISTTNQPTRRSGHSIIWTGQEMIVWGGNSGAYAYPLVGGRYNPAADRWAPTTTHNAPSRRSGHTAIWTGDEMIVWGGYDGNASLSTGRRYVAEPAIPVRRAVSRKTHGNSGDLDVDLLSTTGVESRSGGATDDYTLVITFFENITVTNVPQAAVTFGAATIGSGGVSNGGVISISGNTAIVPLTNVANAQTIHVSLFCVNGGGNVVIPFRRLLGDATGDGVVNSGDATQTRNFSGQALDAATVRADVNTDGIINSGDAILVRSRSGSFIPAATGGERE
jgi:N-acetylneuraminic acid mutarotase